jgi:anti-sigma regulatory factor (Ser/Thr protein kinase)
LAESGPRPGSSGTSEEGTTRVRRIAIPDGAALAEALAPPTALVIEDDLAPAEPAPTEGTDDHGIGLVLCARTVFRLDIVPLVLDAILTRYPKAAARRRDLEVSLQEALANAVIHGSLDVSSALREDPERFVQYCQRIDERLADPRYGGRPIAVRAEWGEGALRLAVEDQGSGYDPQALGPSKPSDIAKSGRGLRMIAALASAVAFENRGRRLIMSFAA